MRRDQSPTETTIEIIDTSNVYFMDGEEADIQVIRCIELDDGKPILKVPPALQQPIANPRGIAGLVSKT